MPQLYFFCCCYRKYHQFVSAGIFPRENKTRRLSFSIWYGRERHSCTPNNSSGAFNNPGKKFNITDLREELIIPQHHLLIPG